MPWMFGWPVLDVVFCMAILSFFVEMNIGKITFPKGMPQIYLLVGLWIASIMSHVANTYFKGILDTYQETFKICFFTILLFTVLDRSERLKHIAMLFVLMSVIMSIHALMQDQLGYGFMGQVPMWQSKINDYGENTGYYRSYFFGIFEDPNDLAQILAASIPFSFLLFKRSNVLNLFAGSLLTWLFVEALLATHSRGGLVGLIASVAFTIILVFPARWLPYFMITLVVGGLVAIQFTAGFVDVSFRERVVYWGLGNQYFKANPIFGIGYGMFWIVADSKAAHNAFVSAYVEMGLLGYFFWFSLILLGFIGGWRTRIALNYPQTADQAYLRKFAGLGIAALASFSASSYFLSRTFIYQFFFMFAVLGALPYVASKYLQEGQSIVIPRRFKEVVLFCLAGAVASIAYIYISILLLNKVMY